LTSKYNSKQGRKASLAEIVGPVNDPLIGFVPIGFKLIRATEKRFYLYRMIEGKMGTIWQWKKRMVY